MYFSDGPESNNPVINQILIETYDPLDILRKKKLASESLSATQFQNKGGFRIDYITLIGLRQARYG